MILLLGRLPGRNSGSERVEFFFRLAFYDLVMLVSNAVGWFAAGGIVVAGVNDMHSIIANVFMGIADAAYFALLAYFLNYVKASISENESCVEWPVKIGSTVAAFFGVLWFASGFTDMIYEIGPNGFKTGPMYPFGQIGGYVIALLAFYMIFKYHNAFKKQELAATVGFVLVPLAGSVLKFVNKDIAFMPIVLTFSIMMIDSFMQRKRETLFQEQQTELERSRTELMLSQIKPHFIHNALNSIYALCDISVDKTKEAIAMFSDYLRGNFRQLGENELIPFDQELKHVQNYLYIEKMRFDESLTIEYDVRVTDFFVPPLTIQTIVENAVRHGIEKAVGGGTLCIATARTGRGIEISIKDTGKGFDINELSSADIKEHTGIRNSKYRLEKLCGATFTIDSSENKGTVVSVIIPKVDRSDENNSSRQ